jgi:hypothetical protein
MDIGIDEENLRLSRIVSLRSYGNLEQYGIYFLTGEACAIGQRLLFDLSEESIRHLERFLGGSVKVQEGSNVNHRQGQIASVLLPSATVWKLALNIAWNENPGAEYIVGAGDRIFEATAPTRNLSYQYFRAREEDNVEELKSELGREGKSFLCQFQVIGPDELNWHAGQALTEHPRRGDKNIHSASGKTHPA